MDCMIGLFHSWLIYDLKSYHALTTRVNRPSLKEMNSVMLLAISVDPL